MVLTELIFNSLLLWAGFGGFDQIPIFSSFYVGISVVVLKELMIFLGGCDGQFSLTVSTLGAGVVVLERTYF